MSSFCRKPRYSWRIRAVGCQVLGCWVIHGVWDGFCNQLHEHSSPHWEGNSFFTSFCWRLLCFCLYFYSYITLIVGNFELWKNISCVKHLMWVQPVPKRLISCQSFHDVSAACGVTCTDRSTPELACGPCDRRFPDNTGVETDTDNTNTPEHFSTVLNHCLSEAVCRICVFSSCTSAWPWWVFWILKLDADNIPNEQIFNKFEYNWLTSYIKRHPLLFRMYIKVILLEQEYCVIPLVWHEKNVFLHRLKWPHLKTVAQQYNWLVKFLSVVQRRYGSAWLLLVRNETQENVKPCGFFFFVF